MISSKKSEINIRPAKVQDLELMLAWRSNPEVYKYFREQNEPLEWGEHLEWFSSRHEDREDFIIEYKGRRVGSVSVDEEGYLGIYIGETAAQGKGIGKYAVKWVVDKYEGEKDLKAEIREYNKASISLFESMGFERVRKEDSWVIYCY
jgi:RimJ/RimL family protein N-acetyltransferase